MLKTTGIHFFHLPKTAGVSVHRCLDRLFPSEQICPWWLWDQLITVSKNELRKWTVFRGHFLSHLEPYLGRKLATFTLLRDPVERTISHYYHVRSFPEHPFYQHAMKMSLAEFCTHPETWHMVVNYQANYLAKEPLDAAVIARDFTPELLARFQLQERMQYPDQFRDPDTLMKRAKKRLLSFTAVGITEDFENSMLRVGKALKCATPETLQRQNVTLNRPKTDEIDSSTLKLIRELTEVDRKLHDLARSLCQTGSAGLFAWLRKLRSPSAASA